MPIIVRDIDRNAATIIMVDSKDYKAIQKTLGQEQVQELLDRGKRQTKREREVR